ncbi:MAG: 2-C-methyl-D-erythritol 2,4-cyclodiphosphate synthase [Planctomycetota bacterium]
MPRNYVGLGFDIHRLVKGRPLILGGLHLPYPKGLLGHSDGDVLLHAIGDALLGAAGLGDIGDFFPDTDPQYKNMDSSIFLKKIIARVHGLKFKVQGIDTIIFAEEPKLGRPYGASLAQRAGMQNAKCKKSYKDEIRINVAKILGLSPARVNIKAKTMEGLGPVGSKKAIAAMVLVLLSKK